MDTQSGEIRDIALGEVPNASEITITEYEKRFLANVPEDVRAFELAYLRVCSQKKWKGFKKAEMKEAFRMGWNSAVYMKSPYYILTDKEKLLIKEENEKQTKPKEASPQ